MWRTDRRLWRLLLEAGRRRSWLLDYQRLSSVLLLEGVAWRGTDIDDSHALGTGALTTIVVGPL